MLEIVIWDVQHGNASYIKTPGGKHIVIDLGVGTYLGDDEYFSPLLHLKNKYRVKSIDEVIITHPHTDHIDDIDNFDNLSPKIFRRPKQLSEEDIRNANPESDSDKIDTYLDINDRFNTPVKDHENPVLPENNGGVTLQFFSSPNCGKANINNHSLVCIVEYLNIKVIIPGDNETPSWKELLKNNDFLTAIKNADIFVASHHGRESGYYAELFDHFKPDLVIISDGAATKTSVTDKYTKIAKGWTVYKRSDGSSEKRYCLTTRTDGTVVIKIGNDDDTDKRFMNVTIN